MWYDDIGQYLDDQGIGVLGTDIYYKDFDENTPNCIYLVDQAGLGSVSTLGKDSRLDRPELGVRVRNEDDATANTTALAIYELLHEKVNTRMGETKFKRIEGIAEPFFLTQDENDLYIYSINFRIEIDKY